MNNPITVLLAAPSYDGRFDVRFLDSLTATIELCNKNNIKVLPYYLCYDSLIQRARNDYFKIAYQSGVDVLFFIDSDIGWNAEDFVKLVNSDKDMIGGTYRKKTDEEELYAFKALGNDADSFNIVPNEDGLLEVNGLGCGFLKISKKCVKMLYENEKQFYSQGEEPDIQKIVVKNICDCIVNENNHFVSEDIVLGFKWQKLGGKVYLDTNVSLVHSGNKAYTGSVKQWLRNWKMKFDQNKNTPKEQISEFFIKPQAETVSQENDVFKVL